MTDDAADAVASLIKAIREHHNDDEVAFAYNLVRDELLKELHYSDLAVVKMLALLVRLYRSDWETFECALVFFSSPLRSTRDVAAELGISTTTAWRHLQRLAKRYPEFGLLLHLRKVARGEAKSGGTPPPPSGGGSLPRPTPRRGGAGRLDASTEKLDRKSLDNLTGAE